MLEDTSGQKFIEKFLLQVINSGTRLIEDIWIERDVKLPGSSEQESVTTAISFVRNSISNITELLEDDLRYCFEQGFFTFRFVAAIPGSGKTTLLQYLEKKIEFRDDYAQRSFVFRFEFPRNLAGSNNQSLRSNLYFYILAKTFYKILAKSEIRGVAESILRDLFGDTSAAELFSTTSEIFFIRKISQQFNNGGLIDPEEIFFYTLKQIIQIRPNYTFVYLIDELDDALRENPNYNNQQIRSVFRTLLNKTDQEYNQKIPLAIYLAGTSEIIQKFINEETAFETRVRNSVINLVSGRNDEFKQIKDKINRRVKNAYSGTTNFDQALKEIENLQINSFGTNKILRNFCKDYAGQVFDVCKRYFIEVFENSFNGTLSQFIQKIESECKLQWESYLDDHELKINQSVIRDKQFSFGCYATLERNGDVIASAYGGARNYDLLKVFIDNFIEKLNSADFKPTKNTKGEPPDIAFIIAPECSVFLQKILAHYQIKWLNSNQTEQATRSRNDNYVDNSIKKIAKGDVKRENCASKLSVVDINLDDEILLINVFKNTGIGAKTVKEIITNRPYEDLNDLARKVKGIGIKTKEKIQIKIDSHQVCFKVGVFLSHNSKEKASVKKIAEQLKQRQISVWLDEWSFRGGDNWQRVLEDLIGGGKLRSAAIFIGEEGIGPWHRKEMDALLRRYESKGNRVIPVILRSYKGELNFPIFLEGKHTIDFRKKNPDPIEALVQAIKSEPILDQF